MEWSILRVLFVPIRNVIFDAFEGAIIVLIALSRSANFVPDVRNRFGVGEKIDCAGIMSNYWRRAMRLGRALRVERKKNGVLPPMHMALCHGKSCHGG